MASDRNETSTRLVLVRHGESNVTVDRVIGGARTCSGLSELGRRQTEQLRDRLARTNEIGADLLVSSHFARAIETAEIIAEPVGHDSFPRLDGFGEHDPGPEIDGMTFDEYVDRFGRPDWDGDPHTEIFPGGETVFSFHTRVRDALDALLAERPGETIVIACHGGVVDAVFRHLLDLPMTGGFELHTLNTSLTEFVWTGGDAWRVARYNDAAHLEGLPAATLRP